MNLRKIDKFFPNALNTPSPVLRNSKSSGGGVFGTKGTVDIFIYMKSVKVRGGTTSYFLGLQGGNPVDKKSSPRVL